MRVWMPHADIVLQDDEIVHAVHQALVERHPNSRSRPAGLSRRGGAALADPEARAQLELRGSGARGPRQLWCIATSLVSAPRKMPDAKTMGRWGIALGPR